jgi:hypothetical protein
VLRNRGIRSVPGHGSVPRLAPDRTIEFADSSPIALPAAQALIAENLFLRKQLTLFTERKVRPRTTASARIVMLALAKCFDWRDALIIVEPET